MEKRKRSSTEEMKKEKEKVYVFVSHISEYDYRYSLYALDIPSPGTIVKANTTTVTTTTTKETAVNGELVSTTSTKSSKTSTDPERSRVYPLLRFRKDKWPSFMSCIRMDSKLYFLGGGEMSDKNKEETSLCREVCVFDLSEDEIPSSNRDVAKIVMKPVASMNTGKIYPVSFVADGKIYVVSGSKRRWWGRDQDLTHQSENEWKIPQHPPPFEGAKFLSHLVVDRTVFFFSTKVEELGMWSYDMDSSTWSKCYRSTFGYGHDLMYEAMGGEVVGKTLWRVCTHPKTGALVAVGLDVSTEQWRKKEFFEVVRYYIRKHNRVARVVTRLDSRRLCLVEAEAESARRKPGEHFINVTFFDVSGNGDWAEYVTSAHYLAKLDPHRSPRFIVVAAYVI